jgi:hypothetical protein
MFEMTGELFHCHLLLSITTSLLLNEWLIYKRLVSSCVCMLYVFVCVCVCDLCVFYGVV